MKNDSALSPTASTFARVLGVMLVVEIGIMLLLGALPPMPEYVQAIVDAALLTIIGGPLVWRIVAGPLRQATRAEQYRLEARTSGILMAAADGLVVADVSGRIAVFNAAAEQLFGFTAREVIGKKLSVLVPTEHAAALETFVRQFTLARDSDERKLSQRDRAPVRRKGGDLFVADMSFARFSDETGTLLVVTVRDATSRVRLEHELVVAKEQAEAGVRAKDTFLSHVSSQIRTPANAMIGMSGMLLDTSLDAEQHDIAENVRNNGQQLLAILNDILDFAKIENGQLALETQEFQVREVIASAIDFVSDRALAKGLRLTCRVSDDVPVSVLADASRVRQVVANLVENAVKYTRDGDVSVVVSASRPSTGRALLQVSVTDSGEGVTRDNMEALFLPFGAALRGGVRRRGGTGLGLAISKRLSELMGGELWVDSAARKGSTFTFTLPAEIGAMSQPRETVLSAIDTKMGAKYPLHILIADDNPVNAKVAQHILERMGYRPDVVADGVEAYVNAGRQKYDVILMDVQMPTMDGLEATRRIRQLPKGAGLDVRIVAMTGGTLDGNRTAALDAGMNDFLAKPLRVEELQETLIRAAEMRMFAAA